MRPNHRISASGFFQLELGRDYSVLRPSTLWTPASVWKALGQSPFERRAVHARLAARNDFESRLHLPQDAISKTPFNSLDTLTGSSIFLLRNTTLQGNSSLL